MVKGGKQYGEKVESFMVKLRGKRIKSGKFYGQKRVLTQEKSGKAIDKFHYI